jgi:proline iminopeptidase
MKTKFKPSQMTKQYNLILLFCIIFCNICPLNADINISNGEYLTVDGKNNVKIYYQTIGDKNKNPIFFLHGGPGSGYGKIIEDIHKFFDLDKNYIILHDQRGSGNSIPKGVFKQNNTSNLVEDIEKLSKHLKISKFDLWGHSWGSLLAIEYAKKYSGKINKLYLTSLFLGTKENMQNFFSGNEKFFPNLYQDLYNFCYKKTNEKNLIKGLYKSINLEKDVNKKKEAIGIFIKFEKAISKLIRSNKDYESIMADEQIGSQDIIKYEIFFHYLLHDFFLSEKHLKELSLLQNLNIQVVHGRYDLSSSVENVYLFKNILPNTEVKIIENSGHSRKDLTKEQARFFD